LLLKKQPYSRYILIIDQHLEGITDFLTEDELAKRWQKFGVTIRRLRNWREKKNRKGPNYVRIEGRIAYPLIYVLAYESLRTVKQSTPIIPVNQGEDQK
jgi:hypothetical protein